MLKSLLAAVSIVAVTAPVSQAVEFVNGDGSQISEMCIAAAQSKVAIVNNSSSSSIVCNGTSLKNFAKQYRNAKTQNVVNVIAFESANTAPESELCIAAATSNEAYAQVKNNINSIAIDSIACNGIELVKFAKRYNKSFNG